MSIKVFNHKLIEPKWQKKWLETAVYTPDIKAKNKFYNLWMFPYPSAEGMHVGHVFASTGSDIQGRFMRMNGKEVFQPIGYDAFGIHSENFAIKINDSPQNFINRSTKHYEEQFKMTGSGYDWTRSLTTSDIDYYTWTQWLVREMFKAGLAYKKSAEVNFCPSCKTVLADEQVMSPKAAGKIPAGYKSIEEAPDDLKVCERCGTVVEKRNLSQWFLRITDYADKLLSNLNKIDWTEKVKIAQRNWIGKKEGITITYPIKDREVSVTVWTSRPDTNFGATFIVVAPEYAKEKLLKIVPKERKESLSKYINTSLSKSKEDRIEEGKEKTGEFSGLYATNQLNGYEMPIWVSDFVLTDVGTGAVVGVPGHDLRDFQFAKTFDIPIKRVVVGSDNDESAIENESQVQEEEGVMINSEFLNDLNIHEATQKIMDFLEEKGWGKRVSNYHLRDWLISRQRYWGAPIPMIYCEACGKKGEGYLSQNEADLIHRDHSDWESAGWYPAPDLPVKLPEISDFTPEGNGRGPLANHPDFYETECPKCGEKAVRETDVCDTFVDSSWYFLRYPSVGDKNEAFNKEITKNWLPVDLYIGGAEHSVLHLMYARFVTMVLNDLKYIDFDEPFPLFRVNGLMIKDGAKMSKSRGNVINPDEYIEKFGADTLRLYLMFMGPYDAYPDFRDSGIEGMQRFVNRVWRLFNEKADIKVEENSFNNLEVKLHQTVKKVTEDISRLHYNTAISSMMELVNEIEDIGTSPEKSGKSIKDICKRLCLILAPFAPHLAEEVWTEILKEPYTVHKSLWPKFDDSKLKDSKVAISIQINGKFRGTFDVDIEKTKDQKSIEDIAAKQEFLKKWIDGKEIIKTIYVPGRLVNFIVK